MSLIGALRDLLTILITSHAPSVPSYPCPLLTPSLNRPRNVIGAFVQMGCPFGAPEVQVLRSFCSFSPV